MIRVLHVVSSLGTGSGVMSVLMSYHRHMDRSEVQFDYLSFRETTDTFEQEILDLGGIVYHCSRPSCTRGFQREMDAFFAQHQGQYQIMHCHPIFASAVFGPTARKYGIRHVIQHSHTTKLSEKALSRLRNFLVLSLFGRRATDYAACSQQAKRVFFWEKPEQVYLMRNAIDYEKFRFSQETRLAIRTELGISPDAVVVGHVGRFAREKNHEFLLHVFAEYCRLQPDAWLLLLGDGPLMEQTRQLARELQIDQRTIFAGRKRNAADYFSAMDVFLLPSEFEGLGIVLMEAQAAGLPALASAQVPREAKATGLLEFLELDDGNQAWATAAEQARTAAGDRKDCCLSGTEFDIRSAAKDLENYYQRMVSSV